MIEIKVAAEERPFLAEVCCLCHLVKSLVEETQKVPVGTQWSHRECFTRRFREIRRA